MSLLAKQGLFKGGHFHHEVEERDFLILTLRIPAGIGEKILSNCLLFVVRFFLFVFQGSYIIIIFSLSCISEMRSTMMVRANIIEIGFKISLSDLDQTSCVEEGGLLAVRMLNVVIGILTVTFLQRITMVHPIIDFPGISVLLPMGSLIVVVLLVLHQMVLL